MVRESKMESFNNDGSEEEKVLDRKIFLDKIREQPNLLPGTVYIANEPEFVGKFPCRSEITVLPSDQPKEKLGWTIVTFNGDEVCHLDKDVPITNRFGLRPGIKVRAWDMEWVVVRDGLFSIALDRPGSKGVLRFAKDSRNCWACTSIINKNSGYYRKFSSVFRTLWCALKGENHE